MTKTHRSPVSRRLSLLLFIICQLLLFKAIAHEATDWRTDLRAFESAKSEPLPMRLLDGDERFEIHIDPSFIKQKLAELSGAVPTLIDGQVVSITERQSQNGRNLARKFLAREFQLIGFTTSTHKYSTGENFIAEKAGEDPDRVLILSSHIDSVGNAGANDNGTGTIAALAVAKALAAQKFRYSLRVVGFDQEEIGLVGSKQYVAAMDRSQTLIAAINMEMMGTNGRNDGAFHIIDCDRTDAMPITKKIMDAVVTLNLPIKRVSACTTRSDHAAFWNANLPAVVLSENFFGGDGDRCYHARCDVADSRINYDYISHIAKAIALAASQFLELK